jgi:AIPR protein
VLKLLDASIINGSQTQGVLKDFFTSTSNPPEIHVKVEIIVTDDEDLIAEISIARNFQNDVKSLSIVGRRGQLDELEERFRKTYPELKLQKSETEWATGDNDYVPTEKLLQVIAALLPDDLWFKPGDVNKVYTYSAKATCLKDFQEIFRKAKEPQSLEDSNYADVYRFYLDMAAPAWELYNRWKQHPKFAGTGLRSIERENGAIKEVPDGIIFPILSALAEFAVKTKSGWKLQTPRHLDDGELIGAAKRAYMEIARSKPEIMGKTKSCYSALQQITAIYKKLATFE